MRRDWAGWKSRVVYGTDTPQTRAADSRQRFTHLTPAGCQGDITCACFPTGMDTGESGSRRPESSSHSGRFAGIEWLTGEQPPYNFIDPGRRMIIVLPPWLPCGFAAVGLLLPLLRRRTHGRCSNCGYDLRATPERCPECGTPVA